MSVEHILEVNRIKPLVEWDQNFIVDDEMFQLMLKTAELKEGDTLLEIGTGTGTLTRELAKRSKRVTTIERDERFGPLLEDLPKNVDLIFDEAIHFLYKSRARNFNKMVACIPYSICEPLMHYLCIASNVEVSVLIIPMGFAEKAQKHPIFSAFLKTEIIASVPKEAFYPAPKVESALVKITRTPEYLKDKDESAFLRRSLYLQSDKKLKNGLVEALIGLYVLKHKKQMTQNEARQVIERLKLDEKLLVSKIANLPLSLYEELPKRIGPL